MGKSWAHHLTALNFTFSCALQSTGNPENIPYPFLALTLALWGRYNGAHFPHEETEASAGEVTSQGQLWKWDTGLPSSFPTSPLWRPGLKALSPEIIRRREQTSPLVLELTGRERSKGKCSDFIWGPPTWCLIWASQKPQAAGTMIPSSQESTPSQEHNVYLPGGTRTNKRPSPNVSPDQFEAMCLPPSESWAKRSLDRMGGWEGGEELLNKGCLAKGMLCPTLLRSTSKLRSGAEGDDSSCLHMDWVAWQVPTAPGEVKKHVHIHSWILSLHHLRESETGNIDSFILPHHGFFYQYYYYYY